MTLHVSEYRFLVLPQNCTEAAWFVFIQTNAPFFNSSCGTKKRKKTDHYNGMSEINYLQCRKINTPYFHVMSKKHKKPLPHFRDQV